MPNSDASQPLQPSTQGTPTGAAHAEAPSPDGGYSFRIARVQEWTLGAVIAAAVGFGVWMGTLNTKLEHLEKFVDSASDGSTGIFIRLAVLQRSIEVLDKGTSEQSSSRAKLPEIYLRSNPQTQSEDPLLGKLIDSKLVEEMLKPDAKPTEERVVLEMPKSDGTANRPDRSHNPNVSEGPANPVAPHEGILPSDSALSKQQMAWLRETQKAVLAQLDRLENEVKAEKKMQGATRSEILNLIDMQRERVNLMEPPVAPPTR